jgi:hypothetical protein
VVQNSKISFYVAIPEKVRNFVEQQIHAQYPHAEIIEEVDYNIFKPQSHIMGAYLWFKNNSVYPFKTYRKMDSDPLVGILNPLSKIMEDEGAVIQFVVRPATNKWRSHGVHMIRKIREGNKFEYVTKEQGLLSKLFTSGKNNFSKKKNDPKNPNSEKEPYRLSQMEEEMVKSMEEKISHGGLEMTIRLISSAGSKEKAQLNLENTINAFSQFNIYRYGNSFAAAIPRNPKHIIRDFIYRSFREGYYMVANTEEMASFWHLPMPSTETPHINWLTARKAPPPLNMPNEGIILGRSVYRGEESIVRMS